MFYCTKWLNQSNNLFCILDWHLCFLRCTFRTSWCLQLETLAFYSRSVMWFYFMWNSCSCILSFLLLHKYPKFMRMRIWLYIKFVSDGVWISSSKSFTGQMYDIKRKKNRNNKSWLQKNKQNPSYTGLWDSQVSR